MAPGAILQCLSGERKLLDFGARGLDHLGHAFVVGFQQAREFVIAHGVRLDALLVEALENRR